jgi:hypothetical protein
MLQLSTDLTGRAGTIRTCCALFSSIRSLGRSYIELSNGLIELKYKACSPSALPTAM